MLRLVLSLCALCIFLSVTVTLQAKAAAVGNAPWPFRPSIMMWAVVNTDVLRCAFSETLYEHQDLLSGSICYLLRTGGAR